MVSHIYKISTSWLIFTLNNFQQYPAIVCVWFNILLARRAKNWDPGILDPEKHLSKSLGDFPHKLQIMYLNLLD